MGFPEAGSILAAEGGLISILTGGGFILLSLFFDPMTAFFDEKLRQFTTLASRVSSHSSSVRTLYCSITFFVSISSCFANY